MTIRRITAPGAPEPAGGIFSNCLEVNGQIFLSGMTAGSGGNTPASDDAYEQCRAVLAKIKALLEAAGSGMQDVVKITVYITDISVRAAFGKARAEFFGEPKPCSTMVIVKGLVDPALLVEVDAVAVRGAAQ